MAFLSVAFFNDWSARWSDIATYIEAAILLAIIASVLSVFFKIFKQKFVYYFFSINSCLILLTFILDISYAFILSCVIFVVCSIIFLFVNIGEIRQLVANPLQKAGKRKIVSADSDLYKRISSSVRRLSQTKTGAIITFERSTSLTDFIKSGTALDCEVSSELLETIFYEGTRLHDGAVIIRGSKIIAASVFYPPSTQGLTGKYGARHRAALGISEITDSITIIVSEETGRIAIAHAGILDSVASDEFERMFKDAMASTSNKAENK